VLVGPLLSRSWRPSLSSPKSEAHL
jgi:hypothetical protein